MKLVYFQDPKRNFGDDLNPWLWDRLLPGLIDGDTSSGLLFGVGTILEPWFVEDLEPETRKYVLGSGGGMTVPAITLDDSWTVRGVRGPLTAAYLGLPASLAATDPAMCIGRHFERPASKSGGVGFMPHHAALRRWDWRRTCEEAGLIYLDPHADPLETMAQIANCDLVLADAMHAAIVADALRVPWFPLQISPINYVGKWHDWAASIRMPIHFQPLPDLYDPLRASSVGNLRRQGLRRAVYEWRQGSSRRAADKAAERLQAYAKDYEPYLSRDEDFDRAVSDFEARLAAFRAEIGG